MWSNHGTAWDAWPAMILMMAIVVVVVTVVVALLVQSGAADRRSTSANAREILDARLARGEIDAEEYEVRREALSRSGS